ncbi:MAG: membrane protein insertase YidC [Mycoplasma sp.]
MSKKNNDFSKIIMPSFASNIVNDNKPVNKAWKITKLILKFLKIAVFLFLFSMGLYGCGQSMFEFQVSTSTVLGNGLEIGFLPGTTGDPYFDLSPNSTGSFFPFASWSMSYGPFYAFFVWPFGQLLLYFMYATRSWPMGLGGLLGIIIILLIIKLITALISIKSTFQTEKMNEIQGKVAEINAKYKDSKDMQSRQKKQQETQELYRKHNVKPFASFEQIFVTLPIFLIIYRVITIVRPLKASILFDIWDLGLSPVTEIFSNFTGANGATAGWTYIFFLLIVVPTQFVSQMIPQKWSAKRNRNAKTVGAANNKALKRTKNISLGMNIFMALIAAVSATGIGLYWFFSALMSMLQSYIIHVIIMKRRKTKSNFESKLSKLGLN